MKTLKPIKELISFRMDENKIWWLRYDITQPLSRKQCREYDYKIDKFCEEDNDFLITPESYYVNSPNPYLPELVFPKPILRNSSLKEIGFWKKYPNQAIPSPYYGNPHYKKYIEDNNGECPLPLPKDVDWIQTRYGDGKKYDREGRVV